MRICVAVAPSDNGLIYGTHTVNILDRYPYVDLLLLDLSALQYEMRDYEPTVRFRDTVFYFYTVHDRFPIKSAVQEMNRILR